MFARDIDLYTVWIALCNKDGQGELSKEERLLYNSLCVMLNQEARFNTAKYEAALEELDNARNSEGQGGTS